MTVLNFCGQLILKDNILEISMNCYTGQHETKIEKSIRNKIQKDSIVSFQACVPISLQLAMKKFIERHPDWNQYRLIQAALAGFLVQHGVETRSITRLYIGNMAPFYSLNDK